jgi:acyl carrier protein
MNTRFDAIENKVKELLARYLESSGHPELEKHGEITGATNLSSDFTLDSFQIMEFLMEMEESFDIMIDMNNLSNAHTVNELAKVVDSLLES